MRSLDFSRYALSSCVVAVLADCGGNASSARLTPAATKLGRSWL